MKKTLKFTVLVLALSLVLMTTAFAAPLRYDINGDGKILNP